VLVFIQPAYGSTIRGGSDCGKWIKENQSDNFAALSMRAWLVGFMSGMNLIYSLHNKNDDRLSNIKSNQQIYSWMDNYCQKNPLNDVDDGAISLFNELKKK
jgi:hypothetical protein